MATQGPTIVSSGVDVENSNAWANPGNVTAVDATYASIPLAITPSDTLRCTMSTRPFSITGPATGVFWEILCHQNSGGAASFALVKLVQGGVEFGSDMSSVAPAIPASTDSWLGFGGPSDTWGNGASIAAATINSSTFGIDIQVTGTATDDVLIDAVRATITYSGGATESSELIAARACICG